MKKFFSLVLALVMALSLTTAAWGAPATMTFAEFETALAAASGTYDGADATVVLTESAGDYQNGGASAKVKQFFLGGDWYNNEYNGAKITISNVNFVYDDDDTTDVIVGGEIQVYTQKMSFVNCTFDNVAVNPWGEDNGATILEAEFDGCTFENVSIRSAIQQNKAPVLKVTDCTFEDCDSAIHTRAAAPTEITITGNTFTNVATNAVSFGNDGNPTLSGDVVTISGNDFGASGIKLWPQTVTGDVDVSGNYWGGSAPSDTQVPAEFVVDTYATSVAPDGTLGGMVSAAGAPMNHPANCSSKQVSLKDCALVDLTTGDSHDFAKTDKATLYTFDTITSTVNGVKTTEYGVTVYYFDGLYGLVVAKDYANAQLELANGKFVYLRGISAAEFVNASGRTDIVVDSFIDKADVTTKCNACKLDVAVVGEDYYEAEGTTLAYYKGEFVLIGDKKAVTDVFTAHAFVDDTNTTADCKWNIVDNKFTSVKCACGDSFKVVQSVAGLKSGTYVGTAMNVAGESNWVVLRATTFGNLPSGGTVVPPSTDKVPSAETFAAGIAMYVGMSVMAAAGAVVLKKRED